MDVIDQVHDAGSEFLGVIASLVTEARKSIASNPLSAERCLDSAVQILLREAAPTVPSGNGWLSGGLANWQVQQIKALVESRLGDRLSIADLSAAVRLSPSRFSRGFGVSFGCPPHVYITKRRMERAKRLMVSTRDPLCQIAITCGMADQAHFTRVFRRLEGETPNGWRRRWGGLNSIAS